MRKDYLSPYIFLCSFIILLLCIPSSLTKKLREPIRHLLVSFYDPLAHEKQTNLDQLETISKLSLELRNLEESLSNYQAIIDQQDKRLLAWETINRRPSSTKDGQYYQNETRKHLLELEQSLPAKIIARPFSSWNSTCWISIGHKNNQMNLPPIIDKGSPVVVEDCLIGIVEEVHDNCSKVRLISDKNLFPSVRVARGSPQYRELDHYLERLMDYLALENFGIQPQELLSLKANLNKIQTHIQAHTQVYYLAKGIVHGEGRPIWKSKESKLIGTAFNYDFSDQFGPARDLRTGIPVAKEGIEKGIPLILPHDLLVTTGMDGVFPQGLKVAIVTKVNPILKSSYFYTIEAQPAFPLEKIQIVYVLPPLPLQVLQNNNAERNQSEHQ